MGYQFETTRRGYANLSSGSVLQSAPGFPAFPVRLASEAFRRGLKALGQPAPVTVWDPCCGSGYLVTVLALLHREAIRTVIASDIDEAAVRLASKNVGLVSAAGLQARAAQLEELADRFGRASHAEAALAARRLEQLLVRQGGDLPRKVGQADVFDPAQLHRLLAEGGAPDLVITDVPYGEQTDWLGPHRTKGVPGMLQALAAVLPSASVLVLTTRGRRVDLGDGVRALSRFKIGTRAIAIVLAEHLQMASDGGSRA